MKLVWNNADKKYRINYKSIERLIIPLAKYLNLGNRIITVVLVNKGTMRAINRQYRKRDFITDVIAFPVDIDYHVKNYLGDIVVCCEVAKEQARQYRHSLHTELTVLLLHGILHLMGYDHVSDRGEMETLQNYLIHRSFSNERR